SLHYPYHNLGASFESFGWRVTEVDATQYHSIYKALHNFKYGARDGRPTAMICRASKGHGGFSNHMNNHKAGIDNEILNQEEYHQNLNREIKEKQFCDFFNSIIRNEGLSDISDVLERH